MRRGAECGIMRGEMKFSASWDLSGATDAYNNHDVPESRSRRDSMREYGNDGAPFGGATPSGTGTPSGSVRTIAANPPRRRPNAFGDTRSTSDMRRADVTRDASDMRRADVTRDASDMRRDDMRDTSTARRLDNTRSASNAARRGTETRRRTSRRRKERTELQRVEMVISVSVALLLALFVLPALFSWDTRAGTLPLSDALTRSPRSGDSEAVELNAAGINPELAPPVEDEPAPVAAVSEPEPDEPFVGQRDDDCTLRVLDKQSGGVSEMTMGEYLICVLRGEMPGSFNLEALKAQAVAARTYTRYMLQSGGKHGGKADICNSPACCQAYLSAAEAKRRWGSVLESEENKLRAAVMETDGEVMLYDGEPILAVFHASSSGLTRTSGDVWSGDKPYLQPVWSPEPADSIPNYYSHAKFTLVQLREKLQSAFPAANLSGPASEWLTDADCDEGGNVITVNVGGVKAQGSRVRSALGLRSACFTWEIGDGAAIFYVTGHGHGVGLSQYGANQMAADGANYREILKHYYTGIKIGGYTP